MDLQEGFLPVICEVFVKLFGIFLDKLPSLNLPYYDDDCRQNRSYTCVLGGQSILCAHIKLPFIYTNVFEKSKAEYLFSSWGAVLLLQHSKLGHPPALHPAPAQPHNGEISASIVTMAACGKPTSGIALDS